MMNTHEKLLLETRLRNLERKYNRIMKHNDLADEALNVKKEMENIKEIL